MVVAIFRSLEGESLEDYSVRLAERWRIGQKGLDNGVILLVFAEDRQIRLEVGYGLESVIPDAVASRIIREVIAPQFRDGRYATGLENAAREVYARIGPGARAPARGTRRLGAVCAGRVHRARHRGHGRLGHDGSPSPPTGPTHVHRQRRRLVRAADLLRAGAARGWGGGSSGGGFSGGGGSFGGGGASGRW